MFALVDVNNFYVSCQRVFEPKLNDTMDKINRQWGRGTLRLASAGFNHGWKMRQNSVSPCWTTRWEDIPKVI